MVAPGYFASTAASPLLLVVPVSGLSSTWPRGSPGGPDDTPLLGAGLGVLAALAASVPAVTPRATMPAARSAGGLPPPLALSVFMSISRRPPHEALRAASSAFLPGTWAQAVS